MVDDADRRGFWRYVGTKEPALVDPSTPKLSKEGMESAFEGNELKQFHVTCEMGYLLCIPKVPHNFCSLPKLVQMHWKGTPSK